MLPIILTCITLLIQICSTRGSPKDINKKIDFGLKNIAHWRRANKFSLNTKKPETIFFRTKKNRNQKIYEFQNNGQKINVAKEAKYLGLKLDQHLTFKQHMCTIKLKLNRGNSLLAKII